MKGTVLILSIVAACILNTEAWAKQSSKPRQPSRSGSSKIDYNLPVASNEIKIMSYNVENLFDTEHDSGKQDWEFLPKSSPDKKDCAKSSNQKACMETDWTPSRLNVKLDQIKRVMAAQGSLPDILVLCEIENENVVGLLARKLGFSQYFVTNSPDQRGIDVAVLYNEAKVTYLSHEEVEFSNPKLATRNFLAVNFRFQKQFNTPEIIGVFANHWPSQAKPTPMRVTAAEDVLKFVSKQAAMYGKNNYHAVVMGDFNTINSESPNPVKDVMMNPKGEFAFQDSYELAVKQGNPLIGKMPKASYYFAKSKEWNEFDHIFLTSGLMDGRGVELDARSFRILGADFMSNPDGTPHRYEHNSDDPNTAGFSDHFPVVVKLKVN